MFYIVKGEGYRSKENFSNPIQIYEEFRDNDPLTARKKSFNFFKSLIEVLLEGIGKEYTSCIQAKKDLNDYISSNKEKTKIV